MAKLCSAYFSSNGTWVAPAGVRRVWVLAQGGGGGGSGGRNAASDQAASGVGTTPVLCTGVVIPNTSYTITIGQGGTGGAARTSATQNGGSGTATTFGSVITTFFRGGTFNASTRAATSYTSSPGWVFALNNTTSTYRICNAYSGYVNGITNGADSGTYWGGKGGCPGYTGSVGGAGGAANNAGTGSNGTNGTGFGAGGGAGGAGSAGGGIGGNGSAGQLWVFWVE